MEWSPSFTFLPDDKIYRADNIYVALLTSVLLALNYPIPSVSHLSTLLVTYSQPAYLLRYNLGNRISHISYCNDLKF
jgi:hypothetical protein